MKNKIFGIFKIIVGITFLIVGVITLYMTIGQNVDNTMLLIGYIAGFVCIEVYGLYLLHSGWTQIKKTEFKKWILVTGLILDLIIVITVLSLFLAERFTSETYVRVLIIMIVVLVAINDFIRIKEQKAAHNKV
ncbi:hypothetical protein [uncultured Draconibacterium sp.]|uniref:hypothetical protein n=1 Tax=uncultured Draconibacterium sp. TaxID=1573823 RepID=UPI002AA76E1A|nr:hypothetical protein [uncultured Draconibacterium sp.]